MERAGRFSSPIFQESGMLVLFNKTGSFALGGPVALIALETLVLGALAIVVSLRVSLRRS
jgi:hypothetical protein